MDFKDYQQKALLTSSKPDSKDKALAIWCMGLAGETGEAIDYLKKHLAHGHELDRDKIALELGDTRSIGSRTRFRPRNDCEYES